MVQIVTNMVLSIISAVICSVLFSLAIVSAVSSQYYYCYRNGYTYDTICRGNIAGIALNACLAILSLVETVAAIWSAVICCKVACCCRTEPYDSMLGQYVPAQGDQQILFLTRQPDGRMAVYPVAAQTIAAPQQLVPNQFYPIGSAGMTAVGGAQFPQASVQSLGEGAGLQARQQSRNYQKLVDVA